MEAAKAARLFVIRLYDQQDGKGVDGRVVCNALFRAAFEELDALPADQREAIARRVHERSYGPMVGEAGEGGRDAEEVLVPLNGGSPASPAPRPRR